MKANQLLWGLLALGIAAAGCSSDDNGGDEGGTGGKMTTGLAGAGGSETGGENGSGGEASGGAGATGGKPSTGGKEGTGGKDATGGKDGTGGKEGTGGNDGTGGKTSGGGSSGDGGTSSDGGGTSTGGKPPNGDCYWGEDLKGKLVINEVWAFSSNEEAPYDFVELYNLSDDCADLSGTYLRDAYPAGGVKAPLSGVVQPGDYMVLTKSIEFPYGLSNGGDGVSLHASDGTTIDSTMWNFPDADISWGRSPNGTGDFMPLSEQTPGKKNAAP